MAQDFSREILRMAIAQLCQQLGWTSIQSTPMDLLTDVLERYLHSLASKTHRYSEQFGRTEPNLDDLGLAFRDVGVNVEQLEDYIRNVEPVPFAHNVPKYPYHKRDELNFLRKDSAELLSRQEEKEHIHNHLPSLNAPQTSGNMSPPPVTRHLDQNNDPNKRPFASPEASAQPKRPKVLPEDFEYSHYEMKCLTMSVTGDMLAFKAGKLPDARVPPPVQSSRKCKMPSRVVPKLLLQREPTPSGSFIGGDMSDDEPIEVDVEMDHEEHVEAEVPAPPPVKPPPQISPRPRGRPPKSPKIPGMHKIKDPYKPTRPVGRPPKSPKGRKGSPGSAKSPKIQKNEEMEANFPALHSLVKKQEDHVREVSQELHFPMETKDRDRRIDDTLEDVIKQSMDDAKREHEERIKKDDEFRRAREQAVFGPPRSPQPLPIRLSPNIAYRPESPDSGGGSPDHLLTRSPSFKIEDSPPPNNSVDDVIDSVVGERSRSGTPYEGTVLKVPPLTLTNIAKKLKKRSLKMNIAKNPLDKEQKTPKKLSIKTLKNKAASKEMDTFDKKPEVSHDDSITSIKVVDVPSPTKIKMKSKKNKRQEDEKRKEKKKKKNKDKDKERQKDKEEEELKRPPKRHKKISIRSAIPLLKLKFGNMNSGGTESERSTPTMMPVDRSSSDDDSPPPLKKESVGPRLIFKPMLPKSNKAPTKSPPGKRTTPKSPSPQKSFPSPPIKHPSPVREPSPLHFTPSPNSSPPPTPTFSRESTFHLSPGNSPTPSPPPYSPPHYSSSSDSPINDSPPPSPKKKSKAIHMPPGIPDMPPSRYASTPAPPPPKPVVVVSSPEEKKSGRGRKKKSAVIVETAGVIIDADGNKVWICPACTLADDGSPMIGCDECDDWYHWPCVNITSEPEDNVDWFCPRCTKAKKNEDKPKKKRGRKKKSKDLDTSF